MSGFSLDWDAVAAVDLALILSFPFGGLVFLALGLGSATLDSFPLDASALASAALL